MGVKTLWSIISGSGELIDLRELQGSTVAIDLAGEDFLLRSYALSFYVTKTVLVGPNWFGLDHNDLVSTKMKWSRPKWIGQVQIVIFYQNESHLDLTNSFWSWPFHFGRDQINLVRPKPFWTDQNCFGHIEGQSINLRKIPNHSPPW